VATADLTVIPIGREGASVLKSDERRDREQTLDDKVESVRRRMRDDRGRDYPPGD
jgi:uncharacterized protein YqgV (UPF0045/DUF77 family)